MNFFVGHSKLDDVDAALKEATSLFKNPDFLFYFAPLSKIKDVTEKIYKLFPNATCLGTSSHYVYSKSGLKRDVISCFGFKDVIETSADIILEIDNQMYNQQMNQQMNNSQFINQQPGTMPVQQ